MFEQKMAYDMDQLVADSLRLGSYFFSEDTMRFFKSRTTTHFKRINDNVALFITTEKKGFYDNAREANIRVALLSKNSNGTYSMNIDSIEDHIHQGYTIARAKRELNKLAKLVMEKGTDYLDEIRRCG